MQMKIAKIQLNLLNQEIILKHPKKITIAKSSSNAKWYFKLS